MLLTNRDSAVRKPLKETGKAGDFTVTFLSASALSSFIFSAGVCGSGSLILISAALLVYCIITGIWKANNREVLIPPGRRVLAEIIGAAAGCSVYIIGNHF